MKTRIRTNFDNGEYMRAVEPGIRSSGGQRSVATMSPRAKDMVFAVPTRCSQTVATAAGANTRTRTVAMKGTLLPCRSRIAFTGVDGTRYVISLKRPI